MPLKKKKKTKVKKKVAKKVTKKSKVKKKIISKVVKENSKELIIKTNLSGLKIVWLPKANIKINTQNLLKIMMSFGEKKEKELLG